jgi:transglutaminase-like putative cysteine protease
MKKYKVATRNCQSNDPHIRALAYQLTHPTPSNDTNDTNATLTPLTDYQKAYNIYEWTEKYVEYSWYYNSRKGAVGVYNQRTANCCDMAHMIVALSRAAGLPARYRHGTCTFTNVTTGHVWADIYVNGRWIIADASNNNNDFGVIRNWNTTTWKLRGTYISLPF